LYIDYSEKAATGAIEIGSFEIAARGAISH
jgi:hypothetical protein